MAEKYMRIGEIAKKAGVTVRTVSFYSKEGLLVPSGISESGYRLYSDKDLARLMQILMMKGLGFTLGEIKKRMSAMDTTGEVLTVLADQAAYIRKKIDHLTQSLGALEALKEEIVQIDTVDFKKYANILTNLQMKNERYWLIKYIDTDILDTIESLLPGEKNIANWAGETNRYIARAAALYDEGTDPGSEKGQALAKEFYTQLMEMMGGDLNLVFTVNTQMLKSTSDARHDANMDKFRLFMVPALGIYFDTGHPAMPDGLIEASQNFIIEAATLHDGGMPPESGEGQSFAHRFWEWTVALTGGDMAMIQTMHQQFEANIPNDDSGTVQKAISYMKTSLEVYFGTHEGGSNND